MIEADKEVLRLMGFSYLELVQALDGVVKRSFLADVTSGSSLLDPIFGVEFGNYLVNFDILKERFFDADFLLHSAGEPVHVSELGRQMGVEEIDDLRDILQEAKSRFDLNIEISSDHVMFGPPSQKSIEAIMGRERETKTKLEQSEEQLKERLKTIKELLDRYNSREAKILNECESLREEGRLIWIKAKVVATAVQHIQNNGRVN
jgi:hypothetical protein